MDTIETKIRSIVTNISDLPIDADANADLYLDLGMASVHALQLLTDLEEQFGVSIPDESFVDATSIAKLTSMMQGLGAQ
jgi:acyl carrier protein